MRVIALLLVSCLSARHAGSFDITITPGMIARGFRQQRVDAETRAEIQRLEKTGGTEASQGLWEIIDKGKQSTDVTGEAFQTLGRLHRREDAPRIIEWVSKHFSLYPAAADASVLEALGEIGGPEACAYFAGFLRAVPTSTSLENPDTVNLEPWAAAVRRARCLTDDELRRILWGLGKDRWSSRGLQVRSLEFLKGMGDEEAAALLVRYSALVEESLTKTYSLDRARAVLRDAPVPWWVKSFIMTGLVLRSGPKEDLLDIYFALAADVYENNPELRGSEYALRQYWGTSLLRTALSSWTRTTPTAYLEAKRQAFRASMPAAAFARMNALIDRLLKEQRRSEDQRAEDKAREEARGAAGAVGPAPPPAEGTAVPPPAGAKIQTEPFPEPRFLSVESRLTKTQAFVFDRKLKWFGLVHMDVGLASLKVAMEAQPNGATRDSLHGRALQLMGLEERLPKESTWRGGPFLVPISSDSTDDVPGAEWNPRIGDIGLAVTEGDERLILLRPVDRTWVNLRISAPLDQSEQDASYRFGPSQVPAGTWVVVPIRPAAKGFVVFLSSTEQTLETKYRLTPNGGFAPEALLGDEAEKDVAAWFTSACQALEAYEKGTIAKAGGPEGIKAFRATLNAEIETLRRP